MKSGDLDSYRPEQGSRTQYKIAILARLTEVNQTLYDELREYRIGNHIRLEKEKIGFATFLLT
ncbi:MAG: hypothetical protein HGB06_12295 [Chlorobaculum sp.]|nr:hypothetical protein [Chlorobaculum sp.]